MKIPENVYVLYKPKSLEDVKGVIEAITPRCSLASNLLDIFNGYFTQDYKAYLVGFTYCLSYSIQSDSEIKWYKRIVLNKQQFIGYMLNVEWETFLGREFNTNSVKDWLSSFNFSGIKREYCYPCSKVSIIKTNIL